MEEKKSSEAQEINLKGLNLTVFSPTKKPMKQEYPELDRVEEFKDLSDQELRFVWFLGNPSSPFIDDENVRGRIIAALNHSKLKDKLSEADTQRYISGNFPDSIRVAIKKMGNYIPTIRYKAKLAQQIIFDNYVAISNQSMSMMGPEEKKAYVDTTTKISLALPDLIEKIEEAYGVKATKVKDNNGAKLVDKILAEKTN